MDFQKKRMDRRQFLKGAGAVTVGVTAAGVLGGSVFASDDEVDAASSATSVAGSEVQAGGGTASIDGITRYTTYVNVDKIGVLQEASSTEEADVVVVGTGIGGMMCAMILAEQRPEGKYVLLEKNDYLGGSTLYAECNTPSAGSTKAAAYKSGATQAASSSFIKDPILIAETAIDRGKNSAWLFTKHNIGWSGMFYEGGNGRIPIQKLQAEIEAGGVYSAIDLRTSTRASALLVSEDGYEVTGVQVLNPDGSYTNITAKAVVLATGGLSTNFKLLSYYTGQDVEQKCHGWGAGQDGDGHLLVEQTAHGMCKGITVSSLFNNVRGFEYDSPLGVCATMQPKNLYVNQYGDRFVSEAISDTAASGKLVELAGKVFSIMGQNLIDDFEAGGCTRKYSAFSDALAGTPCDIRSEFEKYKDNENVYVADTIEELAELIGTPDLVETVAQYEQDCAAGSGDSVFGKAASSMVSLGAGPYYALQLSSGVLNTNGGIRVDRNSMVCDPYFTPVKGLFAAGVCCSGWDGEIYGGGTCQPVSMWGGSKSARYILENYLSCPPADDWFGPEEYGAGSSGGASGGAS